MGKHKGELEGKAISVTGSPGFFGANLVLRLLRELSSGIVIFFDSMNDYYDPELKEYRLSLITAAAEKSPVKHIFVRGNLADKELLNQTFEKYKPSIVVNLAAQAGVRYSIDHLRCVYRVQHYRLLQYLGSVPSQSYGASCIRLQ